MQVVKAKQMLTDDADTLLATLPERHCQVIELRYGVRHERPKTLEEIGMQLGITKERVRQIEKQALTHLRRQDEVIRRISKPVKDALEMKGGVVRFERFVEEVDTRVSEIALAPKGLGGLVLKLASEIQETRINGIHYCVLDRFPFTKIPKIQSLCSSVLKDSRMGLSFEELVARVQKEMSDPTVENGFVASVVRACSSIRVWNGDWVFHVRRPSTPRLVEVAGILRQASQPLHFTLITERLNNRMKQQSSSRAVHGFLGRNPDVFVGKGRGIFGLREATPNNRTNMTARSPSVRKSPSVLSV